jgi:hypothetical protein
VPERGAAKLLVILSEAKNLGILLLFLLLRVLGPQHQLSIGVNALVAAEASR